MELNLSGIKKESNSKNYITTILFLSIFLVLFLIAIIWTNLIFSSKEFSSTINNNVDTPDIPVNINNPIDVTNNYDNQYKINNTVIIQIDEEIAKLLAKEVLDIIKNETNQS